MKQEKACTRQIREDKLTQFYADKIGKYTG